MLMTCIQIEKRCEHSLIICLESLQQIQSLFCFLCFNLTWLILLTHLSLAAETVRNQFISSDLLIAETVNVLAVRVNADWLVQVIEADSVFKLMSWFLLSVFWSSFKSFTTVWSILQYCSYVFISCLLIITFFICLFNLFFRKNFFSFMFYACSSAFNKSWSYLKRNLLNDFLFWYSLSSFLWVFSLWWLSSKITCKCLRNLMIMKNDFLTNWDTQEWIIMKTLSFKCSYIYQILSDLLLKQRLLTFSLTSILMMKSENRDLFMLL